MKRIISVLALLTAASMSVAGCGGDDDDSTPSTGGTSNAAGAPSTNAGAPAAMGGDGSTPTGGAPASSAGAPATSAGAPSVGGDGGATAGGASSGNVMCDPAKNGVCQNPMDCPFVADGTARMTAGTCGQGCVGKAANCTLTCIKKMIAMTSACATCYADTVNCTIMNCLAECIGDPEGAACKQCQIDQGCRSAFDKCSGLPG